MVGQDGEEHSVRTGTIVWPGWHAKGELTRGSGGLLQADHVLQVYFE
jgi:hypothetical protein